MVFVFKEPNMQCSCLFCGLDMLSTDEKHVSTYCGSLCVDCCKYHALECEVCRDDFIDRELVCHDDIAPEKPTSLYRVVGTIVRGVTDGLGLYKQERTELMPFYLDANQKGLGSESEAEAAVKALLSQATEFDTVEVAVVVTQL